MRYSRDDLMSHVLRTIEHAISIEMTELSETTYLPDLKEFDSLAIADILETLETALNVEVRPELLLPEAFETPCSIVDLFTRSLEKQDINSG